MTVPTRPTLIHAEAATTHVEPFDTVAALAARLAQLAQGRPLTVTADRWPQAVPGLDPFFAYSAHADGDWLAICAVQQLPREALADALAQAQGRRIAA